MALCPPSPIPVRGHGCAFPSPGLCVEPGATNWGGPGDEEPAQLRGTGLSTQFAGMWVQVQGHLVGGDTTLRKAEFLGGGGGCDTFQLVTCRVPAWAGLFWRGGGSGGCPWWLWRCASVLAALSRQRQGFPTAGFFFFSCN